MDKLTHEQIHTATHPFQKTVHGLSAIVTVLALVGIFIFSFQREEIRQGILQKTIEQHRAEQGDMMVKDMTDEELFMQLATDEEKKTLGYVDFLYWPVVFVPIIGVFLLLLIVLGKQYSELKSNGVRIGRNQYPQVYAMFDEMVVASGLKEKPELYLMNGHGKMNAFAACVPGYRRRMVAIYSDIFDVCIEHNDMETLRFVIGHEIGHHVLRHSNFWYIFFGFILKFPPLNYILGDALTRSQEYGADKIGALLSQDKEGKSLTILAAGKNNYFTYSYEEYCKDHVDHRSIVTAIHNFTVNHPVISWRLAALRNKWHGEVYLPLKKPKQ